jgi:hyperosmotically inducible protein
MKPVLLFLAVIVVGMTTLAPAVSRAQSKAAKDSKEGGVGQAFKDSWITSKAKMALIGDKRVSAGQINVETQGGVVMLRGKVTSAAERSAAETIARRIDGVKSVSNALQIVPEAQRPSVDAKDAQVKKAVYERFDADPRLKQADITVRADNGVVTLMGRVPDGGAKARAADLARQIPGVRMVRNELRSGR